MIIPAPPNWLVLAIVTLGLVVFLGLNVSYGQNKPGGYAGRPPADMNYPGRCWCAVHGPRGGCKRWVCRSR